MSYITNFPNGVSSFGRPVSAGGGYDFSGWWGNDIWFVDYDNGSTGWEGRAMDSPATNLYQCLNVAGAGDTIFVRPRTTVGTVGSNNEVITPATTEAANWTIAQGQHDLSIIGTSRNQGLAHGVMFQSYASLTTPTINVLAPFCTIENIGVKGIAAQVANGLIQGYSYTPGTHDGYGLTIDNCQINVYQSSNGGGVVFDSGRYCRLLNTDFWHCRAGVELASTAGNINGSVVQNCNFFGQDTDIDVDILLGDNTHTWIDGCNFLHDVPAKAGGSRAKYIQSLGTSEGVVSRCTFGSETAVKATDNTLSNLDVVDCASSQGASFDSLPST